MKKFNAFTLAEVLITLGIIGVVAAITLPTVINEHKKHVYVNQLKKSYSTLSQGFKLIMSKEGVTKLSDTKAFQGLSTTYNGSEEIADKNNSLRKELEKTFSGIQFDNIPINYKQLNGQNVWNSGNNFDIIRLSDGSYIFEYYFYGEPYTAFGGSMGVFSIDVNGLKGPNQLGRDIFSFILTNDGLLYGIGSRPYSDMMFNDSIDRYWQTSNGWACDPKNNSADGKGCTGRVLEEGKMDY